MVPMCLGWLLIKEYGCDARKEDSFPISSFLLQAGCIYLAMASEAENPENQGFRESLGARELASAKNSQELLDQHYAVTKVS